jgi:hypothetical protein
MKIHLCLAALSTIFFTTIPIHPSVADVKPNPIKVQDFGNSKRTHQCRKPSEIPLPASYKQIEFKQSWCGTVPKQLRSAAPAKYIANNLEWAKLWQTYRSNEALPKIDFKRELILVYVHTDANSVEMIPALSRKGDLAVNVSFTEAGMADTPCTYMFVSIDRRGIKTIDGKPIATNSSGF